jgi:asparagine synthase (glutamine-hydrolysing)
MCGIYGVLKRKPSVKRWVTPVHMLLLNHRGPDGNGLYADELVELGHSRLSILDLSELGSQPMSTSCGRYVVTYNGEIYNYLELREELEALGVCFTSHSDTEVVLASYRFWGRSCVERFRGMFAFSLWDKEAQTLFLARDRCGEKPLFFFRDSKHFYFASELKALVPLLPACPTLNLCAVDMYLHFQYVPEPHTLLHGVHKLPAAHHLTLGPDNWDAAPMRYWSLSDAPPLNDDPVERIRQELDGAVRLTLRSDVPVGVALSGGIDSGAIATLASRYYPEPMHAFAVGYPGRPPYDERIQAKELAQRLGMIFHEVELPVHNFVDFFPSLVRIMDEPIADPAAFGHYAIPKAAADQGIKVLLSGIGGDELFWGYSWTTRAVSSNRLRTRLKWAPQWVKQALTSRYVDLSLRVVRKSLPHAIYDNLSLWRDALCPLTPPDQLVFMAVNQDFVQAFSLKARSYGWAMKEIPWANPFVPSSLSGDFSHDSESELAVQVLQLLYNTWLVSNCLTLGDRVSMAVGVETRMPFLDKCLVETVMGLRRVQSDHKLGHKAWLRKALVNTLSEEVLMRPKRGFQPPVEAWLSGVIARYGENLRGGRLENAGILSPLGVEQLLTRCRSYGCIFFAYKLVLLELWIRNMESS